MTTVGPWWSNGTVSAFNSDDPSSNAAESTIYILQNCLKRTKINVKEADNSPFSKKIGYCIISRSLGEKVIIQLKICFVFLIFRLLHSATVSRSGQRPVQRRTGRRPHPRQGPVLEPEVGLCGRRSFQKIFHVGHFKFFGGKNIFFLGRRHSANLHRSRRRVASSTFRVKCVSMPRTVQK